MKSTINTLLITLLLLVSCSEDDGISTATGCLDYSFYSLRLPDQNNSNNVDFVNNTGGTIATSSVATLFTSSFSRQLNNNRATYNALSDTYYFLDNWNGNNELIEANRTLGFTSSPVSLTPTSSSFEGLVVEGNTIFALEEDSAGSIYVVSINPASGSTTRLTGIDLSSSITLTAIDAVGNRAFATEDNGNLYFMSSTLIEVDNAGNLLNTFTLPANPSFNYVDITANHRDDILGLFVAKTEPPYNGIVHWELDPVSGNIIEVEVVNGLDFNRETVDITFNTCGDRILALSNYISGDLSKFYEIVVTDQAHDSTVPMSGRGSVLGTRVFNELFMGVAIP